MKKTVFQELRAMLLINVVHVKTSAITDIVNAAEVWKFPDEYFTPPSLFHGQACFRTTGFMAKKSLLL